jgi:hypothetical protein
MKRLINQLFTKEEIMAGLHGEDNERTMKIKGNRGSRTNTVLIFHLSFLAAIRTAFFQDDDEKLDGFWEYEGKLIRGNQRRGHIFRTKHP